VKMQYSFRH